MDMEVRGATVAKRPLDRSFHIDAVDDFSIDQHVRRVVRSHRQQPRPEQLRHDTWRDDDIGRGLANEDRSRRLIRRPAVLVLKRQQDHAFAMFGILQRDAAREPRLLVRNYRLAPSRASASSSRPRTVSNRARGSAEI